MRWMRFSLVGFALLFTACAPASGGGGAAAEQAPPRSGRTLVAAVRVEPTTVAARALGQQGTGVATYLSRRMFNADLAILDDEAVPRPYLAEALPQLNTDSWQVFPDGRMETTYRLKPGLTWHNGAPLTGADLVLGWRVYATPELGSAGSAPINLIDEVVAPDSRTVLIRWKRPYPNAGTLESAGTGGSSLHPLPRSVLEAAFDAGPEAFASHPYWTRDYVGLGPYRLARWEPGAFLEGTAFERHVLGAPKIDRVKVLFMSDSNTVLASMLAGEVHLAADTALRAALVPVVLREWGPGRGTAIQHPNQWRAAHFQLRTDYASPLALLDKRVRKALAFAVDKPPINEAAYDGQSVISEVMIPPTSQAGRAVDAAIAKYSFDLRKTEELMTLAGFSRGSDGIYTSPTQGRFVTEIKTNAATDNEAEISILANGWRGAGFEVRESVLPAALAQDNEARATFSGMFSNNTSAGERAAIITTASMARPENRWTGGNRGGFSNAEYDRLVDTFTTTLDRSERIGLLVEMAKIFSEEVPAISLFFRTQPWVFVSELSGPKLVASESNMAWNIQEWEFH